MKNKIYKSVFLVNIIFFSLAYGNIINKTVNINNNFYDIDDQIPEINDLIINDFENFTQTVDDPSITSSNNNDNITFSFSGDTTNWMDNFEKYILDFGSLNFTDFDINIEFEHTTTSSYWGDLQLRAYSYYPTTDTYNPNGQVIGLGGMGDAWSSSGGIHHLTGYPNNVKDKYTSAYGTLGDTGTTKILMNRTGSALTIKIYENEILILSHDWLSGCDQHLNFIMIYLYTGTTTPNFECTVKNFSATLSSEIIETPEPLYINDFSDFVINLDNPYVNSWWDDSHIYYNYEGTTVESYNREEYILTFDEYGNATYFEFYVTFNYTEIDYNDQLTFRAFIGSYYNYTGEYIGTPVPPNTSHILGGGIWDPLDTTTGRYNLVTYFEGVPDKHPTNDGSIPLMGDVMVHLVKNESGLYAECINPYTQAILHGYYWDTQNELPINYILLDFYSSDIYSNVQTLVYDIKGVFSFGNSSVDILPPVKQEEDTNPPFIFVEKPNDGDIYFESDITCLWSAVDEESGIAYYKIKLDNTDWINKGLETQHTFIGVSDGFHSLEIMAVDNANNWIIAIIDFQIDTSLNTTIPTTPSSGEFTFSIPGFTLSVTLIAFIPILIIWQQKRQKSS